MTGGQLAVEHLVCEAHCEAAVADRSRDPLGGLRSDITGDEDARPDSFERVGLARRVAPAALARGGPAEDKARVVDGEHRANEVGAGLGADHHEDGRGPDALHAAIAALPQGDRMELTVAIDEWMKRFPPLDTGADASKGRS